MRDFTYQGLMWMKEGAWWLIEKKRGMTKEWRFLLRDRLRLWIALKLGVSFSSASSFLYRLQVAYFSCLARAFALSRLWASLWAFFVLSLECTPNELSNSSNFVSKLFFFFSIFASIFPLKHFESSSFNFC